MNRIRILAAKTALVVAFATGITAPIYAGIPTIDSAKHFSVLAESPGQFGQLSG